jgi:uncharacterized membrane protein YgcG
MTDRDQGVAAILFFIAGYVAPFVAHYIIPPRSRKRAVINGLLVGAGVPGFAAFISLLAGVHLPVSLILLLVLISGLLGIVSGLQGYVDAPRSYDGRRLTTITEPFYEDLIEGEKPADFDRDNRKAVEEAKGGGVYIGGSGGGGGGFSGGGGGFGGGGASGSW